MFRKELIVLDGVDRPACDVGPILVPFSTLVEFAVILMESIAGVTLQLADPETGLAYVFAAVSLATIGLSTCGYASNEKYSLLGGLRCGHIITRLRDTVDRDRRHRGHLHGPLRMIEFGEADRGRETSERVVKPT
ncbi:NADH-quinone oxidoreductase subunit H [Natrinema gelatinilyticum]|uniref:NADH-quinone oxidoreductase subunit H n=1 Tax=Natrinema gelatinilyticum TaxID=2961571 RepID=UPI0031F3230B